MTPLKRRQFGKLAAASLTTTIVADFSTKAIAQKSSSSNETTSSKEIIYGVSLLGTSNTQSKTSDAVNSLTSNALNPEDQTQDVLNLINTSKARNREDQTPSLKLTTVELVTGNALSEQSALSTNLSELPVLSRVNLPVLSVDNLAPVPKTPRSFFLNDSERVTKAITLQDGTVLISTVSDTRDGYFNHLISTAGSTSAAIRQSSAKKVLDLEASNLTVESLLSLRNGKNQLLCLVATEGLPPFTLRMLDPKTGKILSGDDELGLPSLPPNHRFANLCLDPKGNIIATEIDPEGIPILISINLQEKAIVTGKAKIKRLGSLSSGGRPLYDDVKDLAFSPSGQLYALTADNSRKNNILSTVDVKTGKLGLVRKFADEKFTFSL